MTIISHIAILSSWLYHQITIGVTVALDALAGRDRRFRISPRI